MNELQIVKHTDFNGIDCDFYKNETNDIVMTIQQLSECLGYSDRGGVENIITRNPYIKSDEFSVTLKMRSADGKLYNTRLFNEDGIYEITMLAKTEKAREFRGFVRKTLKAIRKGDVKILPTDQYKQTLAEAKLRNAKSREAALWLKIGEQVGISEYKQICASYATNTLAGHEVIPLPEKHGKYYTATEIGKMLGVSSNRIGKVANANGLKTEEYGKEVWTKSEHSAKQVPMFQYNERGLERLRELISQ